MQSLSSLLLLLGLIASSCKTSGVTTVWKNEQPIPVYKKVLVATVIPGQQDSLQLFSEEFAGSKLLQFGFSPLLNTGTFGFAGLNKLGEDEVFMKLCDAGIDIVMVIAWVKPETVKELTKGVSKKYREFFYYRHLWNYRQISGEQAPANSTAEFIIFDLRKLESIYVSACKNASPVNKKQLQKTISRLLTKLAKDKMLKEERIPTKKGF